ncbi:type IV pilus twitching motility protein PilT [Variovorax sp. LT1P1]|uniref:type IV pilus twitching motility protein PilT n=1 Tax=Variovorax sp. LT1P1 TaxID=3443730 RepID=UPI003F445C60
MSEAVVAPPSEFAFPNPPARFSSDHVKRLLVYLSSIGASDVKFQTGNCVIAKVNGVVHRLTTRPLPPPEVEEILTTLYGSNGPGRIKSGSAIDIAYELHPTRHERYRFRVNAVGGTLMGANAIEITIRMISLEPPTMDQVGLEPELRAGLFPKDGIVIMAGATGSGKSTTLSTLMRHMLEQVDGNRFIMTFEAPIEYVYDTVATPSSTIFQTEIGPDANLPTFDAGVRSAMRRAPDVILNGEMRDIETIEATLAAAQSGHAVYTTVHAHSVVDTFRRIVNFFPYQIHGSVMNGLISSVRAVVWQSLVRTPDGKRVAIREYLVFSSEIREELMAIASQNMDAALVHMSKLVEKHGQTVRACAQRLHAEGRIDEATLRSLAPAAT